LQGDTDSEESGQPDSLLMALEN